MCCSVCICVNCHVHTVITGLTPVVSSQMYHNLYRKMPYLRERMTQLEPLMDKLDPYEPVRVIMLACCQFHK